jgi:hypothetical protein
MLLLAHIGHLDSAVARRDVVVFLAREDVDGGDVDLGVTVLSGLGDGEFNNLARARLIQDDVAAFAEGGCLRGVGEGGAGHWRCRRCIPRSDLRWTSWASYRLLCSLSGCVSLLLGGVPGALDDGFARLSKLDLGLANPRIGMESGTGVLHCESCWFASSVLFKGCV